MKKEKQAGKRPAKMPIWLAGVPAGQEEAAGLLQGLSGQVIHIGGQDAAFYEGTGGKLLIA